MRRYKKIPPVGTTVVVRWLDSGAGTTDKPGAHACRLKISKMSGVLTFAGRDDKLHKELCAKRCRGYCKYLEIAHDSAGPDDESSVLGSIWCEAIVELWMVED